jgi:hypothetical protein
MLKTLLKTTNNPQDELKSFDIVVIDYALLLNELYEPVDSTFNDNVI